MKIILYRPTTPTSILLKEINNLCFKYNFSSGTIRLIQLLKSGQVYVTCRGSFNEDHEFVTILEKRNFILFSLCCENHRTYSVTEDFYLFLELQLADNIATVIDL